MSDRFYKDIELPNLPNGTSVPNPQEGFIQIVGREGKLSVTDPAGKETILGPTPDIKVDGGNATTAFSDYLLRLDFGSQGASINKTGAV